MKKTKRTVKEQSESHITVWKQINAAILIVAGLFLFIAIVFDVTGPVGGWIKIALKGLLGMGCYTVPVLFLYLSVWKITDSTKAEFAMKFWAGIVSILSFSAIMNLFSQNNPAFTNMTDFLTRYYENGNKYIVSGGIFGACVGVPLESAFAKVGASIIIGLILLVSFMLLTGLTLYQMFRALFPFKFKDVAKSLGDKITGKGDFKGKEPEPVPYVEKEERQLHIDIPVDNIESKEPQVDDIINALSLEEDEKGSKTAKNKLSVGITETVHHHNPNNSYSSYTYPPLTLLTQDTSFAATDVSDELRINAKKLVDTLNSFGVETRVMNISRGPSVTRYELMPGSGVKISKIANLADDIALNLAALGVRIEAPIPGKSAVGIEVPNKNISSVYIREILSSKEFMDSKSSLTVCLGKDISGNHIVTDLAKMPHLLIAGSTGSGKSVCINSLIISLLYKSPPDQVKMLMIDTKVVELKIYNNIPHLLIPVVTDPKKAAGALCWAVTEMLNRYKLFAEQNVRDIYGYNEALKHSSELEALPYIVIVIDELADLMFVAPNEVEDAICRLAQMARAAGMHLVIATQRPSVDVITGTIKANIPSRIAFAVSSQIDSRIILDMAGADKLMGKGDMLFSPVGTAKPVRIQGCFVSDKEVEAVTDFIKRSKDEIFDENIIEHIENSAVNQNHSSSDDSSADELLPAAIEVVVEAGLASSSLLQRKLKLGYARAARIIDEMEARGIVGPYEGSKPRKVLITRMQLQEMIMSRND